MSDQCHFLGTFRWDGVKVCSEERDTFSEPSVCRTKNERFSTMKVSTQLRVLRGWDVSDDLLRQLMFWFRFRHNHRWMIFWELLVSTLCFSPSNVSTMSTEPVVGVWKRLWERRSRFTLPRIAHLYWCRSRRNLVELVGLGGTFCRLPVAGFVHSATEGYEILLVEMEPEVLLCNSLIGINCPYKCTVS